MTQVWAHRGASGHAPENTLDAFAAAIRVGADGIELDVHASADGEVVVIHDDTLNRTCGVGGRVASMDARDLVATPATNGMTGFPDAHVPLLHEVFDLLAGTGLTLNIELKGDQPNLPRAVHKVVTERSEAGRVVYSSFNHESLIQLRELGATSPRGILIGRAEPDPWVLAARVGAQAIHPPYQMLSDERAVAECQRRGLALNVWTLDTPPTWERARDLGVDAVITNHPAAARAVIPAR